MSGVTRFHWRAFIGFQLSWFALIYFQQLAVLPVAIYLIFGLYQLNTAGRIVVLITLVGGIALDSVLLMLNVLQFSGSEWLPLWFLLLWALFALAAVEFMTKLLVRPWVAVLLGGIGGPLSYWSGAALSDGILQFPLGIYSACVLVLAWSVIAVVLGQTRRFYAQTS